VSDEHVVSAGKKNQQNVHHKQVFFMYMFQIAQVFQIAAWDNTALLQKDL
jgi:hypothetical protein